MKTFWTVGYAPFARVREAGVFERKVDAEVEAVEWNKGRRDPQYRGRGCRAVRCDESGRLVR